MKNNGKSNHEKLNGKRNSSGYLSDIAGSMEMKTPNSNEKNNKKMPRKKVLLF